jgi:curved DNA-binding protein CbpA
MAAQSSRAEENAAVCAAILAADDHYDVLQVPGGAKAAEIRRNYLKISARVHPDRNTDPRATAAFQKVSEAYAVLSDEQERRKYDAERFMSPAGDAASNAAGAAGAGAAAGFAEARRASVHLDLAQALRVFRAATAAARAATAEGAGVPEYLALAAALIRVRTDDNSEEGMAMLAGGIGFMAAASAFLPESWKRKVRETLTREAGIAAVGTAAVAGLALTAAAQQSRAEDASRGEL